MNKRGDAGTGMTLEEVIRFLIAIIFFGLFAGCMYKVFFAQECPLGYTLILNFEDPEINRVCGTTEELEDVVCCLRKSNPLEIIRWDKEKEEVVRKVNLGSFSELYPGGFTCKEEVPCGMGGENNLGQTCAGVYCPMDKLCRIKTEEGKKKGECVSELEIKKGEITATVYVMSDESLLCGQIEDTLVGTACNEKEKQLGLKHCIFDITNLDRVITGCRGAI